MTPPDGATPAAAAQPAMTSAAARAFWNRLSRGEQLVLAGAAALVVGGDWILGAILNLGGVPIAVLIAASQLALLIVVHEVRAGIAWPIPFALLVLALATIIVVPSISDVLYTLRSQGNGGNIVGELFDWVCAGAVAVGTWMIWRADPA